MLSFQKTHSTTVQEKLGACRAPKVAARRTK